MIAACRVARRDVRAVAAAWRAPAEPWPHSARGRAAQNIAKPLFPPAPQCRCARSLYQLLKNIKGKLKYHY